MLMKIRGTKYPRTGGKGENTPLPDNVGKKSVYDAGQQTHDTLIEIAHPIMLYAYIQLLHLKSFSSWD